MLRIEDNIFMQYYHVPLVWNRSTALVHFMGAYLTVAQFSQNPLAIQKLRPAFSMLSPLKCIKEGLDTIVGIVLYNRVVLVERIIFLIIFIWLNNIWKVI